MKNRLSIYGIMIALLAMSMVSYAIGVPFMPADDKEKNKDGKDSISSQLSSLILEEEEIPDSLLHPRWKIQRTTPITDDDLQESPLDLRRPENLEQKVEYNDTLERYIFGKKMGDTWINTPVMMTPEEYLNWTTRQKMKEYFRAKNDEIYQAKGKEKFDFTDMHFDLGPAEKIFGPGGVRIKTQGSAELKFGATIKEIDNPSLPIRNRKTTTMNFDEKINLHVNGKVGDKVDMNLNYNTEATFDFDTQNMKLKYDGKEDEIIKLVEAGNISFPSNSSLIKGSSALFGLRTDMQFGKLKLQMVASQKKSNTSSVNSRGGVQLTPFEMSATNYEENRHFFLSQYFHDRYDAAMKTLPNLTTGVKINRIEVWVTNKSGTTSNTRNIIALTDLGESDKISNPNWSKTSSSSIPANQANNEYSEMVSTYSAARDVNQTSNVLEAIPQFAGGTDYEKLESARLLSSSEYTVNTALGYISLKTALQTDQVLAVAFEYTYGGQTYQVGEFASDLTNVSQALFVKTLKNTSNNPRQGNWSLMMKNVYYLASSVQKDKFRLDVKFQSDTAGVYLTYLPEAAVKDQLLIKVLGADRLDNNMKPHSNGAFDYVEGYTVSNGRVFLPAAEPFGKHLYNYLISHGVSAERAEKYAFTELYDSTKTIAKQIAEKDKYKLLGQFRGTSANVISLGAYNVPQGSVVVTAGGMELKEGIDYTVDYNAGEVTILNQSIIDAGTAVNVSLESNTEYGQQRKTMFGLNWQYDFTKDFQLSGTIQHLREQALTTKVNMGSEPLQNTLWGLNINWKHESQWLTNMLDKIPFLHVTQPSQISFTGEFAQLIAGQAKGTQDNASYLDDFENSKNTIDISSPTSWIISSVPSSFPNYNDKSSLQSGYNRSLLAWYNIDPLFTRRTSSLTPGHIKSDLEQLSNHYVREVYVRELFPNRNLSSYNGAVSTQPIMNLAYYPTERGPYNFNTNVGFNGQLTNNPRQNWGGMMRKLDTNDFEAANVEYVEFWMLDPFIYERNSEGGMPSDLGGDFYINLGEISEDVLCDGKKFYESGMPVDGSQAVSSTQWGKIPTQATVTYGFATSGGSRAKQDVGFNGLTDAEETTWPAYQEFINSMQQKLAAGQLSQEAFDSIMADPANDDYHYYRGSDFDQMEAPILRRYKRINNPQGNSPDSEMRSESYDTSYKTTPDAEDINQDYTLNEYEKYFQYKVSIRPEDLVVGQNYIVDKREASPTLRNGNQEHVTWYQFRIPLSDYEQRFGNISDLTSIRFIRLFLTGFEKPIILRFGSFDLVRGEWREYEQNIDNAPAQTGKMAVSAVNIEENNDKTPVNYTLPPGIRREQDPTQPQLVESNEQALGITVTDLSHAEGKAIYKNTTLDLRQYKRLQMYVHANALEQNITNLSDNQLALFVRLGSDYKSNYYEYEIPLKLTPAGHYDTYSLAGCRAVWPEENMLDIPLTIFTNIKKERNKSRATGAAAFNHLFSAYQEDKPQNKISIMGNPSLGEVKTMVVGIRNLTNEQKSGEVWINELRLLETNNNGGWAAQGNLNVQLSDFGTVNVQGRYISEGFGGLEDGVAQRSKDDYKTYTITTNLELGKFFPDKAKVTAPFYYSVTKEETRPKYNPLDTDMELDDALSSTADSHERDSLESIAVTKTTSRNLSFSNVKVGIQTKRHPMPYDPGNFSFTYSHSHRETSGQTTVYEKDDHWRGAMNYSWVPVYKTFEPFKKLIKSKSQWFEIIKRFGLNWLPQNVGFNTELDRTYYELQERDLEDLGGSQLPVSFRSQFTWDREFTMRWDLTKNLHMNFQSATHAEIEEPNRPVNKSLYPDDYAIWKDSVWQSIKEFGRPLTYNQNFQASYQVPINLIPIFDWVATDASYNATYNWTRGTEMEDGTSLGNTITTNRTLNINSNFNLEKLYNHIPFLKQTNERFNKEKNINDINKEKKEKERKKLEAQKKKEEEEKRKQEEKEKAAQGGTQGEKTDKGDKKAEQQKKELPKNSKSFVQEIRLLPDTTLDVNHGKNTKRFTLTAKTADGKPYKLSYKKLDANKIRIKSKVDSTMKVKLTLTPKAPLEENGWYKAAQWAARLAMSLRSVSVSYSNKYSLTLPGFMPNIGDAFGQTRGTSVMAPGLDFAFGFVDDSYIETARNRDWLLMNDSVATPATTNKTEDIQIRMTLEPVKNFKIDLNASRTQTTAKSIQYMYAGNPTTQSGTFTMTTISLGSAFEKTGDANNGYHSATFEKFCNSLDDFRDRVEAQYANAVYPAGTALAGQRFDPANGGVNKYSADVMVPAFLSAYTSMGGNSLNIFPTLTRLLPNWSVRYSGLGKLPWFRDVFKSVNINHAYKSIYAVGAYNSYSTFVEYMDGLGFVSDIQTGNPIPSSMYNVSTVSINESFSPLLGIDVTLQNNLTAKVEYRTTRVLSLSMTSVQINENRSNDWVIGLGYKINNFRFLAGRNHRAVKGANRNNNEQNNRRQQNVKGGSHDLNLRLDVSIREQTAISRDIASRTSNASSGSKAFKFSFMADYTLSKMLTMSFFYDRTTNTPLLTSSSYPTTTRDFGLSIKMSLTR